MDKKSRNIHVRPTEPIRLNVPLVLLVNAQIAKTTMNTSEPSFRRVRILRDVGGLHPSPFYLLFVLSSFWFCCVVCMLARHLGVSEDRSYCNRKLLLSRTVIEHMFVSFAFFQLVSLFCPCSTSCLSWPTAYLFWRCAQPILMYYDVSSVDKAMPHYRSGNDRYFINALRWEREKSNEAERMTNNLKP